MHINLYHKITTGIMEAGISQSSISPSSAASYSFSPIAYINNSGGKPTTNTNVTMTMNPNASNNNNNYMNSPNVDHMTNQNLNNNQLYMNSQQPERGGLKIFMTFYVYEKVMSDLENTSRCIISSCIK